MADYSNFPPWTPTGPFPMRVILRYGHVVTIRDESTLSGYRFTSEFTASVGWDLTFMDSGHYFETGRHSDKDIVGPDPGEDWELVVNSTIRDGREEFYLNGEWTRTTKAIGTTMVSGRIYRRPIAPEPDATLPAGEIEELRAEIERLRVQDTALREAIHNAATQIAIANDKRADAPLSAEAHLREACASLRMSCDKPTSGNHRADVWEWLRCHDELGREIERLTKERDELYVQLGSCNDNADEIIRLMIPDDCIVRSREGGGPENVQASLAISVSNMRDKLASAESKLAESESMSEQRACEIVSQMAEEQALQYRWSHWANSDCWFVFKKNVDEGVIRFRPVPSTTTATYTGTPAQLAALAKAAEEIGITNGGE